MRRKTPLVGSPHPPLPCILPKKSLKPTESLLCHSLYRGSASTDTPYTGVIDPRPF